MVVVVAAVAAAAAAVDDVFALELVAVDHLLHNLHSSAVQVYQNLIFFSSR